MHFAEDSQQMPACYHRWMANEKNNTNELASTDADATAEVEQLTSPHLREDGDAELEADADTCRFEYAPRTPSDTVARLRSELRELSETVGRLNYDIEQLKARRKGLEAEVLAREEVTTRLNAELSELEALLEDKEGQLCERDDKIAALEAGIRRRDEDLAAAIAANGQLQSDIEAEKEAFAEILRLEDTGQFRSRLAEQAGRLASHEAVIRELTDKFARAERYSDSLRRQLQDASETTDAALRIRDELQHSNDRQAAEIGELQAKIAGLDAENSALSAELAGIREAHADELRQLRFELGEAQQTASQHELVNEQLAADLVQTHGFTVELESKLDRTDRESRARIEELERENRRLRERTSEQEEQLSMKSETIHALFAELGKNPPRAEEDDEIEPAIPESIERLPKRSARPGPPAADRERVTRVLIGSVEGKELQFPLFKDRLTIGRTEQNDIQLNAPYISRRHAVIVTEGDTTKVVDRGSKNGVFVNSRRIGEHPLSNGDIIAMGIAKFRYEERPMR
jgi:chromosome segregation ATPase